MNNFFIKEGYINNPVEQYDLNQKYWTKKRIKSSKLFQYSVYLIFFDEVIKRVISLKNIFYNQVVVLKSDKK
jgi:hypothetical protein